MTLNCTTGYLSQAFLNEGKALGKRRGEKLCASVASSGRIPLEILGSQERNNYSFCEYYMRKK